MMDCYIYGLCASDGCMKKCVRGKNVYYSESIELSEKQILEDISNELNLNIRNRSRVINNKVRRFYSITFPSHYFRGIEEFFRPGRIGIFDFFISLDENDKHNFIRGLFDGDGTVSEHPKSRENLRVGFSINSKCTDILRILDYLENTLQIKFSKYLDKRGNGSYYYSINSKSDVYKFYSYIYDSPKFFLKRKYNIFIEHGFPDLVTNLKITS